MQRKMSSKAILPFDEPVQGSNYLVLKSEIKKTKTIISTNLTTLTKLKKTPPPTLYRKRSHMATIEHCRSSAGAALSNLRDFNTSSKSTDEVDVIQASIRDLHEGKHKYSGLIKEFDNVNAVLIEEVEREINSEHSSGMPPPPPPPAAPGVKYIKHDELMPEVLPYGISPVEYEQWAESLTQWLQTCYFNQVSSPAFASSLINRLDATWKRKMYGQITGDQSPELNLDKIRNELKSSHPIFNRQFTYFNIKQENREAASDTLDRIILQSKVSNVNPISQDDLTVHILVNSLSDARLKEKILEIDRIDGNIEMNAVITAIKSYEANALIATKNKPVNNAKNTSTSSRDNSSTDRCQICNERGHSKRSCTKKCRNCDRSGHKHSACWNLPENKHLKESFIASRNNSRASSPASRQGSRQGSPHPWGRSQKINSPSRSADKSPARSPSANTVYSIQITKSLSLT